MPATYWTTPGEMRQRVTVQAISGETDPEYGGETNTWEDLPTVWAKVIPLGGSEQYKAGQFAPESIFEIRMRYMGGITQKHRIKLADGTLLDITNINDIELRHRELRISAKRREGQDEGYQ